MEPHLLGYHAWAAAVVDRLTFRAQIIETGTESYRLRASQTATEPDTRRPEPETRDRSTSMTDDYPAVTARDIAEFLDHLAALRYGAGAERPRRAGRVPGSQSRTLLTRIADQHAHTDPAYAAQVRQIATDALTAAAEPDRPPVTTTTVGPTRKRTTHPDAPRGRGQTTRRNPGPLLVDTAIGAASTTLDVVLVDPQPSDSGQSQLSVLGQGHQCF